MAIEQKYEDDVTGALSTVKGSDGRGNVSSRTNSRGYYNSRDEELAFSSVFDFQAAAATEYGAYLKNTSSTLTLVISAIGVNSAAAQRIKLHRVTGTAAAGDSTTPVNMHLSSPKAAAATAMEGASAGTGITGLSSTSVIDFVYVLAGGHEELRLDDRLRLGQNEAIAIQNFEGTGDISGVIFFYYE